MYNCDVISLLKYGKEDWVFILNAWEEQKIDFVY